MTSTKNLIDEEFKKIASQLAQGKLPNGRKAVRVYNHPIKKRTIIVSEGQRKGVRRGQ